MNTNERASTAIMDNGGEAVITWCEEHDAEIPYRWKDCRMAVTQAAAGYYPRITRCAPRRREDRP